MGPFDVVAGVVVFAAVVLLTMARQAVTQRIPALERMRELNKAEDAVKLAKAKYPPMVSASGQVGKRATLFFLLAIAPCCVTLAWRSLASVAVEIVSILMVYDFAYYLTHRFVFHGSLLREVHAVHHQARDPSYIDAHYVHPTETLIGIALFVGTIVGLVAFRGRFHAASVTASFLLFTQLNILNHTKVRLAGFPFNVLTWISVKHAAHHENMRKGNYATITLFYDALFGTLE